jgi:nucleotide-binding universal stress UspA family protein
MFRSLLVALDGTPFGEYALPLAVSIARRTGADIHLVHVHDPVAGPGGPTTSQEHTYLEELARKVQTHAPGGPVRTFLLSGTGEENVADALAAHLAREPVDLIVLNSHTRGGLSRWWLGNLADELVHRTSIPLLVTPDIENDPGWHPEAVLRHVLVGLDGTPLGEQILPAVLALGNCMGASSPCCA